MILMLCTSPERLCETETLIPKLRLEGALAAISRHTTYIFKILRASADSAKIGSSAFLTVN